MRRFQNQISKSFSMFCAVVTLEFLIKAPMIDVRSEAKTR